ncbi:universal stress protein [Zunongwangia sp. SCSIO 43204]|uniref:universal stress protein n=1 Tax=Zunongwangia sp. SCSIO 43204 TaxID=2779359 RepID=UPI001CA8BE9B|nr:universal stress protein [Zunongwangia sp. SCSIO 43204]UAB84812.1 universal stress protein [Zunongwangia sp. SCSIO 43204]
MKKILVPTDFSIEAENALKIAAKIAKKFEAEIYLLHMLDLPLSLIDPVQGNSQNVPEALYFMKLAHMQFSNIKEKEYLNNIAIAEAVQFNYAFKGITEFAKNNNCDLIVMGSHGSSGFQEMFIGSNTEKVVRQSEIPVLVIKEATPDFNIEKFIFATDTEIDNKKTLLKAIEFAKLFDAELNLLFVNTPNNFTTSKQAYADLDEFLKEMNYNNVQKHIYNDVSVEKGILNFAEKFKADLIGISTHGRKGLAHFFNGSISEDLVNHAKRPVITFKI